MQFSILVSSVKPRFFLYEIQIALNHWRKCISVSTVVNCKWNISKTFKKKTNEINQAAHMTCCKSKLIIYATQQNPMDYN